MPRLHFFLAILIPTLIPGATQAQVPLLREARVLNAPVKGKLLDFTANHGRDCRFLSKSLGMKRDLYVYLPPGYTPTRRYPVMVWLHAIDQDERGFLDEVVYQIDKGILDGTLPPLVVAAPDGTLSGEPAFLGNGSFFLNTPRGGRFEDHLLDEVWPFLQANFSLRPEPQARVLAGISMGGCAAFNKVLKCPDLFGVAMGIFPPLHLRYADAQGRVMSNFRPDSLSLREDFTDGDLIVGRFFLFFKVRLGQVLDPLFDRLDPTTVARIATENPYEMLNRCRHQGKVALYVGYGGRDEFNVDAQAEAFVHRAGKEGVPVETEYLPLGGHLR
jgi:S-formylglutathione hydrolase FrmB